MGEEKSDKIVEKVNKSDERGNTFPLLFSIQFQSNQIP